MQVSATQFRLAVHMESNEGVCGAVSEPEAVETGSRWQEETRVSTRIIAFVRGQ